MSTSFDPLAFVAITGAVAIAAVVVLLVVWSLVWVYQDANARGKPGWLVALLCFFCEWPLSLLMWLVLRPELPGSVTGKPVKV